MFSGTNLFVIILFRLTSIYVWAGSGFPPNIPVKKGAGPVAAERPLKTEQQLFHAVFVFLDHVFNHLAAD